MRSSPSSSCSHSLASSSSSCARTRKAKNRACLTSRLENIFKKAHELTTLCDVEACVIYYGPDRESKTWPEDRQKVRDIALRFIKLDEAKRRKKSVDLYGFLKKKTKMTNLQKKTKTNVNEIKYPISDHYSPDQISQLIQSLELNYSILQERRSFLEAEKQKKTNLEDHKGLTPSSLKQQTQSLNPSQFSLFMYNHEDATLSQIPLSASNFNQVPTQFTNYTDAYSAVEESGLKNHLMHQELYGCDQNNMFTGNINGNNFQHPCVSNTQYYTALPAIQESAKNYGLNQLMQHELCGYDQSMCMSGGVTSSNVLDPCLSNTVSNELCSDFQDQYGCMVGNTQNLSDMFSRYDFQFDESSLLQTSTLPSLYTIPNC